MSVRLYNIFETDKTARLVVSKVGSKSFVSCQTGNIFFGGRKQMDDMMTGKDVYPIAVDYSWVQENLWGRCFQPHHFEDRVEFQFLGQQWADYNTNLID